MWYPVLKKLELFLNGKSLGNGQRDYHFLYTFKDVAFVPGKLEAVGYDKNGKECCRALNCRLPASRNRLNSV